MTVGQNIRSLRKRRGLTLQELGGLCGISGDVLARYERGEKTPRRKTVEKIATALDVPIVKIQEGVAWTAPQPTEDWETRQSGALLYDGILKALEEDYGSVRDEGTEAPEDEGARRFLVGGAEDRFVLDERDIRTLMETVKASIPALVEGMGDTRPEEEINREILSRLAEMEREDAGDGDESEPADCDLTDEQWEAVRDLLPPEKTRRGRNYKDNRLMLNGILYWMRTGTAWRKLPRRYGRFRCVYDRLRLWNDMGIWEDVLERIMSLGIVDESAIVVDSRHFKEYRTRDS